MKIDIEKALLLTVGIILSIFIMLILTGCKKNDPQPIEETNTNTTITEVKASTLSIVTLNGNPKLYINGEQQLNLNQTFIVHTRDKVRIIDNGFDSTKIINGVLYPQEGRVTLKLIVDNNIIYEQACNCDVDETILI